MPIESRPPALYVSLRVHPVVVVLVVAALTCLVGLGRPAITDSDEAFYAEAAREMVESGDYLTPRFNYANRFQKPVLYYWATCAAYVVAGVGEGAARLPSALSGLGLALLAWSVGRRVYGDEVGRLAGLLLGTSLGLVTIARLALPDLPLAFFVTLATWAGMRAMLDRDRLGSGWLLASAASMGAAFLMKGPVGVVVPAIVLAPLVLIERRWRVALKPAWLLAALIVFSIIALPWYWLMYREHGTAYLESFFIGDNLERFATDRFNDPRPPWFYLPIVVAGMLPWSPFFSLWAAPAWAVARRRRRMAADEIRLGLWAVLPLALFTLSVGKQPRYILPSLLPLAVGLAASILGNQGRKILPTPTWRVSAVAAALVVGALGAVIVQVPPDLVGAPQWRLVTGGLLVIAVAGAAVILAVTRPRLLPPALVAASVTLFTVLHFTVLAPPGPETVEQVAARVKPLVEQSGARWTTREVFVRNLVFYVGHPQSGPFEDVAEVAAFLRSPEPALAVVSERDLPALRAAGAPAHPIAEWQYFNVAAVRWRHLFTRNPGRAFRTVVLVSNRDMIRR